jgi:nitrite reductase/ring-hydroxylating ferredoxin subunit
MAEYVRVAGLSELAPGERMATWMHGIRVMVVNVGGQVYAVDEQCTHMQCSLMEGPLKGAVVGCPCHLAAFDLRTGKILTGPTDIDLPTYDVRIEGDDILVRGPDIEIV